MLKLIYSFYIVMIAQDIFIKSDLNDRHIETISEPINDHN